MKAGKRTGPWSPDDIIAVLRASRRGPLKAKDIGRALGVSAPEYASLKRRLRDMERDGRLYRVKGNRYAVPGKINLVVGRLATIRAGDGFVTPDDGRQDVFIPAASLESAMDGDRVVARIEAGPRAGARPAGRVVKVLERAHPSLVGTFHRSKRYGFVVPQDPRISRDVFVPPGEDGGAGDRDVVVVRITSYGNRKLGPVGSVERVLGPITDPGVDVLAVVHGHRLPLEFPPRVEEAAARAARAGALDPGTGRTDRTGLHVFTIDPSDAKDHDDALSIEPLGDGRWEVGIHIADVSHYVVPGDPVDAEAFARGTSVYLVDRVIPMLPEVLSSEECSLVPGVDRLSVSLFIHLDEHARVRRTRFEKSRIRSRQRLSYEEAERVLRGEGSIDAATDEALRALAGLARRMRAQREARGSLDFDLPEARVELGEEGEPVDIQRVLRLESHRLIEEFMLLANEVVARRAVRKKLSLVFRVHEPPLPDRTEQLRRFLAPLGYSLPRDRVTPTDLQRVLKRCRGRAEEGLVSMVVLRSLRRARYSAGNEGHFGLASRAYAHFTSPIRRYPDLIVHRVVKRAFIDGKALPEEWGGDELASIAEHASDREQVAAEAERDSIELKKIEFMLRHLGDEFAGTISSVTSFGLFILLDDFFVEGLVHVSAIEDDYYQYREQEFSLVGERSGRRFRLGDRVQVQVARVDKEEREIDFVLIESIAPV